MQQTLADFCDGSGAVVSFGDQGICAGDLATNTFRFALCACENVVVEAQLLLDSFDSSDGPYGGSNVGHDGNLGVNQGPLLLDHKMNVFGSAYIGGGGLQMGTDSSISHNLQAYCPLTEITSTSGEIGRNASTNGDVSSSYTIRGDLYIPAGASVNGTVEGTTVRQPIPKILPCPCADDEVLNVARLTTWARTNNDNNEVTPAIVADAYAAGGPSTLTLPCGRFFLTQISQPSSFDIIVTERAVLFVDGSMATQRLNITVHEGAELDLFVAGDVVVTASADFGSADQPAMVRTYIGGDLDMQASAGFAGNVYAPNANVVFGANTTIHGALMARNVTFGARTTIHFDSAIRTAADDCDDPPPMRGRPTPPPQARMVQPDETRPWPVMLRQLSIWGRVQRMEPWQTM